MIPRLGVSVRQVKVVSLTAETHRAAPFQDLRVGSGFVVSSFARDLLLSTA